MGDTAAMFWSAITGAIVGGGLTAMANHFTATKMFKEQRFASAASDFSATVISELKGTYPVPISLSGEEMNNLKDSKPSVLGAAKKFRPHVKDKKAFDDALVKYQILCSGPTEPSTAKLEGAEDNSMYRDELYQFSKVVDALLDFTK